jgi:TRAP transporter TAXI family solute receptor
MKKIRSAGMVIFWLLTAFAITSTFPLTATAAEQPAHDMVRVPVLTLPMGAGVYEWWASFERIFEANHPWLRISAQETPGFIYNLKEMASNKARWRTTLFGTEYGIEVAAEKAIEPFFEKSIDVKPFKYLFPLGGCGVSAWIWVTLDPKIKTMMDFQGKRIGLGLRGQIAWGLRPAEALDAMGIKAKLEYLGPLPAIEALLDGRVDVAQVSTYSEIKTPDANIPARPQATLQQLLASRRKFYYVGYDDSWIERMRAQKGYTLASNTQIAAGTLPNQDKKLTAIEVYPDGWAAHETFPDDVAYEFTKFMIEHGKMLTKYSKVGEYFFIPKGFLQRWGYTEQNVHPGAIRAYKEAGLWK